MPQVTLTLSEGTVSYATEKAAFGQSVEAYLVFTLESTFESRVKSAAAQKEKAKLATKTLSLIAGLRAMGMPDEQIAEMSKITVEELKRVS